jgi:hypothetical protein
MVTQLKKEAKKMKPKCEGTESSPVGSPRQRAFCGRMCGHRKRNTKNDAKKNPDSCINQSLRRWKCRCASSEDMLDLITAGMFGELNNTIIREAKKTKVHSDSGLGKWFGEEWTRREKEDGKVKYKPCGRKDADKGKYPKCQPKDKWKGMSNEEADSAVRRKRKEEPKDTESSQGRKPNYVSTKKKKSNTDIVCLVRLAMEGGENKENVKSLAMQAYKQIISGDPQKAIALLMQMFGVASLLTGKGIFSDDFEDFLTDEGMIEWVSEFVEDSKKSFSDFDDEAFKMIALSLHEIVDTNNFFNDNSGHIEVEE